MSTTKQVSSPSSSRPSTSSSSSSSGSSSSSSSAPSAASTRASNTPASTSTTPSRSASESGSARSAGRTSEATEARRSDTGTGSRGSDNVDLSDDARGNEAAASESSRSPVDFRQWGLNGSPRNGNVSAVEAPGAGKSLQESPRADAQLAEQLASKPLELGKGEMLSRGDEGDKVSQVQAMLNKYAGKDLATDGDMGRETSRAVRQFQRANKLRPDGVVGPRTRDALNKKQAEFQQRAEAAAKTARATAGVQGQQGSQSGTAPERRTEGSEPARRTEGSEPARRTEGGEPARRTEGSEPARRTEGSEPARRTEGSEPARRTEGGAPDRKADGSEAAQQAGASEAARQTAGVQGQQGTQSGAAAKREGIPPATPSGGTPTKLGRLDTLQSAQKNQDGSYSFKAGATIDVDGEGPHYGDRAAQSGTSLEVRGADGKKHALNADKTPYFVLPPKVAAQMGAKPGDLGIISYKGKNIAAVFGDRGPGHRIGELSRKAALDLGIPASPTTGGVPKDVEYRVFPGTAGKGLTRASEVTPERLNERVQQLFNQDVEAKAGQAGASTQGAQVPPAGQVNATGQTPKVDRAQGVDQAKAATKAGLPVPVPNGLREIMKTFGHAGSGNLEKVMAAAGPGGKEIPVSMHKKIAGQFQKAFDEIKKQGLSDEIQSFDGGYSNRSKASGSGAKSTHAWGIAFDINADKYPMGTSAARTSARFKQIAEILDQHGFKQLPTDPMHFQYATGY